MSIEQMKFAYLKEKGCALTGVRKIPDMGPDDVLVKQLVCNICTTDYGQWDSGNIRALQWPGAMKAPVSSRRLEAV